MSNRVSSTVSDDELNHIIQIESAGNPKARASTSSASGLGQHLNATWLVLVKSYRPEWMKGRDRTAVLNLRFNASMSIEMLARLTEESRRALPGCTAGDLYLAHFLGIADARKFFRANSSDASASLVSAAVVAANRDIFKKNPTAGAIRMWAQRKMSGPLTGDWVRKYYTGEQPRPAVKPKSELPIDDDLRGRKIEEPLPPPEPDDVDVAPPARDPVPQVEPAPPEETQVTPKADEGFFEWIKRKSKTVVSWFTGGSLGLSGLTYFTDWKIAAVVIAGLIVAGTIVGIFYLLAKNRK